MKTMNIKLIPVNEKTMGCCFEIEDFMSWGVCSFQFERGDIRNFSFNGHIVFEGASESESNILEELRNRASVEAARIWREKRMFLA